MLAKAFASAPGRMRRFLFAPVRTTAAAANAGASDSSLPRSPPFLQQRCSRTTSALVEERGACCRLRAGRIRRFFPLVVQRRRFSSSSSEHEEGKERSSSNSNNDRKNTDQSNMNIAFYLSGVAILTVGLSYASVPLYQAFCQVTGYGGTVQEAGEAKLEQLSTGKTGERTLIINFDAGTGTGMPWKFKPLQQAVKLVTGETALAFYNAENPTNHPMTGVATYNVTPMKAGLYFNKVQCFCFHEQRLQAKENVDMPVFFFIDNEFESDPRMDDVSEITLSYTFFPIDEEEEEEQPAMPSK